MSFKAISLGILAACLWAGDARAQVISIGDDGRISTLCTAWQNPHSPRPSAGRLGPIPATYAPMIARAASAYEIAPDLLDALARQESNYNPAAVSRKGAIGIMQLMPATARALGVDPYDPAQNIMGGAAMLRQLLNAFDGQIDLALAGYNAGQGAVIKYGGIPPYAETRAYVGQNLDKLAAMSDSDAQPATTESEAAVTDHNYIQACR